MFIYKMARTPSGQRYSPVSYDFFTGRIGDLMTMTPKALWNFEVPSEP